MKKGATLEGFVAYVYQNLLFFSNCDSVISQNAQIKGKSGATHEFDVYYEFYHLNILFHVAIECKDWLRPVDIGAVRDFAGKLGDLNRIAGVMVSKNGYQRGAEAYADANGIMLLKLEDLPTLPQIVAEKFRMAFLPDDRVIGEPFWTIMQLIDGRLTGSYYSISDNTAPAIPLFFAKSIADQMLSCLPDKENWCVRGVSQVQLKVLIGMTDLGPLKFLLCPFPSKQLKLEFIEVTADFLKENYCI